MSDDVIRCFIAVEISEAVRTSVARFEDRLKEVRARVGWVAPQNIHVTLVFLGEVFAARVPEIAASIDEVATRFTPFSLEVKGAGFFGPERSPRVLWIGMKDMDGRLGPLQGKLADAMRTMGFHVEDRPFTPHLTIGRVRSRAGVEGLTSMLASAKNTAFGSVNVGGVLLMQSHLEHQGVRYSRLHESLLKGA